MVPPAFAPTAAGTSPKFEWESLHANPNLRDEFGGGREGALECAITGASRLSYNIPKEYSCESNIPIAGA